MAQGEEEVVQVGQPGLERVQRETLYSNGTVIKTNDVSKVTQREMVPTIIKEGTREVTTSRNVAGSCISRYRNGSFCLPCWRW